MAHKTHKKSFWTSCNGLHCQPFHLHLLKSFLKKQISFCSDFFLGGGGGVNFFLFLAHLSRRLKGELIVYRSIRCPWVRASVRKHFQTRISPQPVGQS